MEEGFTTTRLDLAAPDRFIRLRRELGVTSFGLNVVLLDPGQRGRIHRHGRQEEVYLVLQGALTLMIENEAHLLGPNEAARVAPGVRRQLSNLGTERVALLALGGAETHDGRDGEAFASWDDAEPSPPADVPLPPDLTPPR